MSDEHDLYADVTPAVVGSMQHLQESDARRRSPPAQGSFMRRPVFIAVAAVVILASLGAVLVSGWRFNGRSSPSGASVATVDASASALIDARRVDLLRRIDEARDAGHLKGVGYMASISEHGALLVAQRRAEAQGMTDDAVRELNAAIDHASANLERHLRAQ